MENNQGWKPVTIVLALVAVIALTGVAYQVGKNSGNNSNIASDQDQQQEIQSEDNNQVQAIKQYTNNDLGISFKYPKEYGNITIETFQQNPESTGPFNVVKSFTLNNYLNIEANNTKYFRAQFSSRKDIYFGGGFECWGCDGGEFMGDSNFWGDQKGFEKFYTTSGDLGLLFRGQGTDPESPEMLKGYLSISFQVNNDYKGVTFYMKDTSENIQLLKSIVITK